MKNKILLLLICLPLLLLCSSHKNYFVYVSIVKLIATPERYCGNEVVVKGYLISDSNDIRIYLDANSANYKILDNGISIALDDSIKIKDINEYNNKYVHIEGEFICISNRAKPNQYKIVEAKNFRELQFIDSNSPK